MGKETEKILKRTDLILDAKLSGLFPGQQNQT